MALYRVQKTPPPSQNLRGAVARGSSSGSERLERSILERRQRGNRINSGNGTVHYLALFAYSRDVLGSHTYPLLSTLHDGCGTRRKRWGMGREE